MKALMKVVLLVMNSDSLMDDMKAEMTVVMKVALWGASKVGMLADNLVA
jgi:hypothetical protein